MFGDSLTHQGYFSPSPYLKLQATTSFAHGGAGCRWGHRRGERCGEINYQYNTDRIHGTNGRCTYMHGPLIFIGFHVGL